MNPRSLVIAAVAAVAMCGTSCRGVGDAPPVEARPALRVMSFNVRYGTADDGESAWPRRRALLFDTIAAFAPDLLGTQEVLAFQRDELLAALPGYAAHAAGRDDGRLAGEMTAIFYREARFELLDGGHFWLSQQPDAAGSVGWDADLTRMASWVRLRDRAAAGGGELLVLNAHLDHRGERARLESARLLRREAERLRRGARVVVTGDFNDGEGSPPHAALFGHDAEGRPSPLVDAWRAVHPSRLADEGTFNGFGHDDTGGERIDWIAVSREWEVRAAAIDRRERGGLTPSDHYPVSAVLK